MGKTEIIWTAHIGPEKRCALCGEFWPLDKEFFNRKGERYWHSYCRSCMTERRRELRKGAARKIAGYHRCA